MSAYANDPRVSWTNDFLLGVQTDDGLFLVFAVEHDAWWTEPRFDPALPVGMSRDEADAYVAATQRGPYQTVDEAIRTLIGDLR